MALKTSVFILGDVFDLGLQIFVGALAVGQIIGHIDGISDLNVLEDLRAFFYQDTYPFGRDVPQLKLIEGRQAFSGKLHTVKPLSFSSCF